jgi:hypothetical protein
MPTGKLSGKVAIVTGGARAVSVFINYLRLPILIGV